MTEQKTNDQHEPEDEQQADLDVQEEQADDVKGGWSRISGADKKPETSRWT